MMLSFYTYTGSKKTKYRFAWVRDSFNDDILGCYVDVYAFVKCFELLCVWIVL